MMQENDPRIKELQTAAWSLQTMTNKPGNKIPEPVKRDAYKVTSKGIELCNDAIYIEEEDWVKRAGVLRKQIEAKRVEVEAAEKEQTEKNTGKCYRSMGNGQYTIGSKTSPAPVATPQVSSKPTSRGIDQELAVQSALALYSETFGPAKTPSKDQTEGTRSEESEQQKQCAEASVPDSAANCTEMPAPPTTPTKCSSTEVLQEADQDQDKAPSTAAGATSSLSTSSGASISNSVPAGETHSPAAPCPSAATPASSSEAASKLFDEIDEEGRRIFRVEVQLPDGIASVRDLEVDISDARLLVQDTQRVVEFANVALPTAGDSELAKAAFSKKKRLLTVTLPAR